MLPPKTRVIRNGKEDIVPAEELVIGDIVKVVSGVFFIFKSGFHTKFSNFRRECYIFLNFFSNLKKKNFWEKIYFIHWI